MVCQAISSGIPPLLSYLGVPVKIFGTHDQQTIQQLQRCIAAEENAEGVLCADGHVGYSMPIGGVVAYERHVSPSGVGYDIACGNFAVKTRLKMSDVRADLPRIATEIERRISFGVGRKNSERIDDPVFDMIARSPVPQQRGLLTLAKDQLSTVGSGNHYVDVLEDLIDGHVWVACHFGSRGFGHKTATMFMNVAQGLAPDAKSHDGEMHAPPLLLDVNTPAGQDYIAAMNIAGEYAYAGRRHVVARVLDILGVDPEMDDVLDSVHNHHNFTWYEHGRWVVRKGATPAFPGQRGFIGGSMGDICVIVEGVESPDAQAALYSTVHGAGRVKSRNVAIKGRHRWQCPVVTCNESYTPPQQKPPKDLKCSVHRETLEKWMVEPAVDFEAVRWTCDRMGIVLRGAGPDEAPECYRPLGDVLRAHKNTINIVASMVPRIVVMAGKEVRDPYKD